MFAAVDARRWWPPDFGHLQEVLTDIVIAAIVAPAVPGCVQEGTQLIHVLQKEGGV